MDVTKQLIFDQLKILNALLIIYRSQSDDYSMDGVVNKVRQIEDSLHWGVYQKLVQL